MRELKIACAAHRKALKWKNITTAWPDLRDRLCATAYTAETQDEYWAMGKDERDAAKDKGCFVGGYLNNGRRKTENVGCRSLIMLDGDELAPDFISGFQDRCRFAAVLVGKFLTHIIGFHSKKRFLLWRPKGRDRRNGSCFPNTADVLFRNKL